MINGNEYKAQAINISYDSLMSQDSGKTDDGVSHIAYILSKIRVVNITLPPTTGDVISSVLQQVQGKTYTLTYFDVLENAEKTIECYTGTSAAEFYNGVILNGLWRGVAFTATELGGEA